MERTKHFISVLIILGINSFFLYSQSDYRKEIYEAYIQGNMQAWEKTIGQMETVDLSLHGKIELINFYYGYIGYLIGTDQKELAGAYIKKGEKIIHDLLEETPSNATLNAFKGSFISFKIGLNKLKAISLGPQSMRYINQAYNLDPNNVQALADKANMFYYAPSLFGGDKKKAITFYQKAIHQLEENEDTVDNWFYLNLLVQLAQHYEEMKMKKQALSLYEKILRQEPGFVWIKEELYPRLLKIQD